MNREELGFLADHVSTIDGRRPARLAEVEGRIRIARRRRATGSVAGAAVLSAAVIAIVAIVPRSGDSSNQPIDEPQLPTVSPIPEPAGQTVIPADFGPQSIVDGNVAIGSAMSDPGATELHASLPYVDTPYAEVVGYCRGSADTWWVTNGSYGQCSPDAALEPVPPEEFQPVGNAPRPLPEPAADQEISVDMVLTGPLTARLRHCIVTSPDPYMTNDCLTSDPDVTLLKTSDATFGFTAYVHSAPKVIHDPFHIGFEALASLDGTDYLFTHGVVSAPGANRLATYLDVSENPRLVLLILQRPQTMRLEVDGERSDFPTDLVPGSPWYYGRAEIAARAIVPPGSHNVTVEIPDGAKGVGLLVYEAEAQP